MTIQHTVVKHDVGLTNHGHEVVNGIVTIQHTVVKHEINMMYDSPIMGMRSLTDLTRCGLVSRYMIRFRRSVLKTERRGQFCKV